ncbi:MAG: anti-sigma factor [Acidimicrobiales bacterium]
MNSDDARIGHLMGEPSDALDNQQREELDDLSGLLADPSVWAVPPEELEERVVDAIAQEAATAPAPTVGPGQAEPTATPHAQPRSTESDVVDLASARSRRTPRRWAAALGASVAAAAVAAVVMTGALRTDSGSGPRFETALAAVGAPGPSGSATLSRTDSGWDVVLEADGLPRLDNGRYYQAWLRNAEGVLVPLGSFNEGGRMTLWSGVSPVDFPVLTITVEAADGNQASSGDRVLAGTVDTSPQP